MVTMIAEEHDDGVFTQAGTIKFVQNTTYLSIDVTHAGKVRVSHASLLVGGDLATVRLIGITSQFA